MNKEEAIEVLKNTEDNINYDKNRDEIHFTHKWVGAYEMAIAALREPPVVFCIKCKHHGMCLTEKIFLSEGIKNPFCCRGE